MVSPSLQEALVHHLEAWGLKRFTSDEDYFAWQRQHLSAAELKQLNDQVERKRQGDHIDEIAFYDLTVQPKILPVLYSQRYDYYSHIGIRVAAHMGEAKTVLDFGCGVGILTTFYARQFPGCSFIGVDRSPLSIARAQEQADTLGLRNVRFESLDIVAQPLTGLFDTILATHALVQAEEEPGLPSRDWTTFERARDAQQQRGFEERTGVASRLDRLCAALAPRGRMIVFEKARLLSRRVPFQRALAARGLSLIARPEQIRYQLVEEVADDGPLYVMQAGMEGESQWDESPEPDEGKPLDRAALRWKAQNPHIPFYENHWPSAQRAWQQLRDRTVTKESTSKGPDGRQLHVELGMADAHSYLYCANTFDQRQLVIMQTMAKELETYYEEIVSRLAG